MSDSVGSVSVEVVPDARGWAEKLRAQIRDTSATVNVNADTAEANAQIDEAARTRTATIKADTSQLDRSGTLSGFLGDLGAIPALALTAGSALIPLAAAIGGVVAAVGAPLAVAGGGVGLFALFGTLAAKSTEKQLKNITTLEKKLAGLTKGTATYAATQKELLAAQKALTPAQHNFADSLDGLKAAFSGFLAGKTGQDLLNVIASGMDLLAKTLPVVAPVLAAVTKEIGHLLDQVGRAAGSKGFADFLHQFAGHVGPDISIFARIIGNLAQGIGSLVLALDTKKLSGGVLDGLLHLSQNFANLGQGAKGSRWLKDFIDYFHQVGPQVAHTLAALGKSMGHIVEALAPLGPSVLHVIQGIADAFNRIPIPVLTAIAGAAAALTVMAKANKGVNALSGFVSRRFGGGSALSGGLTGGAGGIIGGKAVVPVFVTNEGFGKPGAPGGPSTVGTAEKGVAGGLVAKTAASETAAEVAAATAAVAARAGLFTRVLKGLGLDTPLPALGSESGTHGGITNYGTPVDTNHIGNLRGFQRITGTLPGAHLTPVTSQADALIAMLGRASRGFDALGHSAAANAASAVQSIAGVQRTLNSLRDKKFAIIAQTQDAITSLERLQALTIRDKHFNVIQNNVERTVGPGGGRQHHARGGYIAGPGSATSDSILARLSNGEYVMRAAAVEKYGRAMFDQLNRFADGGSVDAHHNRNKPLFTHEGPHWYKAAYKHGRPFAKDGPAHWDWPYQTGFDSQKQANEFQHWVRSKNVPFNLRSKIVDYDMRGYWKKFHWHGNKLIDERNGQVVFASGGGLISGPGGPRDDRVPAWLSNGEYVVNAAATTRHRALLEQLNRGTYLHSGGMVGRSSTSTGGDLHSHVYLDGKQIAHVVTPIAEQSADRVYHANRGYEDAQAGR